MSLIPLFIDASLQKSTSLEAARAKSPELSHLVQNSFFNAVQCIEEIKPIFSAAANTLHCIIDKFSTKKSEQGLPWAPAGMTNGAENLLLKVRRALWRNRTTDLVR